MGDKDRNIVVTFTYKEALALQKFMLDGQKESELFSAALVRVHEAITVKGMFDRIASRG